MNFLLTLLLIFIVFRLVSWLAVRFLAYKVRKATSSRETVEGEVPPEGKKKKKVIQKDEGDYVDFEEIEK
jgi:hypothetical protein